MMGQELGYINYQSSMFHPGTFGRMVFPKDLEVRLRTPEHLQKPLVGKGAARMGKYCSPRRLGQVPTEWTEIKPERVGIKNVGDLLEAPNILVDSLAKYGKARELREETIRFLGGIIIDTGEDRLIRAVYPDRVEPRSQLVPNNITANLESVRKEVVAEVLKEFGARTETYERIRRVLESRFGFDGKTRTLEEVGQEFGVSRERVRRLEERGLIILGYRQYYGHLSPFVPLSQGSIGRDILRVSCSFELIGLLDINSKQFDRTVGSLPLSAMSLEELPHVVGWFGFLGMPLRHFIQRFLDTNVEEVSSKTTEEVLEIIPGLKDAGGV